jgi:hypothetical protein
MVARLPYCACSCGGWIFSETSFGLEFNCCKWCLGSSSIALVRLLPFLPPVVVGIFVLFSAFWPQRILFFSAKQRRKFINGQFLQV